VRRLALYPQIWAFRMTTWPQRKRRADRDRSILTPSHASRLERWHAGRRDAVRLFRERQPRGDAGRDVTVARDPQRMRQAQGQPPRQPLPAVVKPSSRHLTSRRAAWLVRRRPARQDEDEAAQLAQLQAQPPEVATAIV
jgi:hypothetical protein